MRDEGAHRTDRRLSDFFAASRLCVKVRTKMSAGPVNERRKSKLWISLIWAILPTVVISGSFHFFDDLPDRDEAILLTFVWLPAGIICEKLGFGDFSVIGSSTIPNWIFFTAMVVTSYLYSLILVFLVRFVIRFGKTLWLKANSKE